MRIRSKIDHAKVAAWVEHMKGVYQGAIDDYAVSGQVSDIGLSKIRNHVQCLAMIQELLSEHHEMNNGRIFDAGATNLNMITRAHLVKPDGTVIPIKRKGD